MKKNLLILSSALLLGVAIFVISCKKEDPDTTTPSVTLIGDAAKTISLQGTYTEEGANATDDRDGALTPTVTGSVNVNLTGDYTLTYTATDAAGNQGTATRTITVKNDIDYLAGSYTCTDFALLALSPWTQTISSSTTKNKEVVFGKFAGKPGNNAVRALLDSANVLQVVPSVSANVTAGGSAACKYEYQPVAGGTVIAKYTSGPNIGKWYFKVRYNEKQQVGTGCAGNLGVIYLDEFLKQ